MQKNCKSPKLKIVMNLIFLPIYVLEFWYLEAPKNLLIYFYHLNKAFLHLFSLPLMIRTFFRPWKNEYREGLIWFSIFMGIVFKTILIFVDLILFAALLFSEVTFFVLFLAWPALIIYVSFVKVI